MRNLEVLVVGAGTGGLCLAHGLRAAGIGVRVFERDRSPTERVLGYRLTINSAGARGLKACLPEANFKRYIAASAKISTAVSFLDHKLHRLLSIELPPAEQLAPEAPRPISRIALRQILLEGLEGLVTFGKTFVGFERMPDDRVIARFEDGSIAEGSVLVGADGAASRVRRQLLPQAQRMDTGLTMVTGRFALDAAARRETPAPVFRGPTMALGPRGCFLFAGAVEYPASSSSSYDRGEYVAWGFSTWRESLRLGAALDEVPAEAARAAVLSQMHDWSPDLRRLIERADPASVTAFSVKSSIPVRPWATSRITLLGDALHNMTPFRGIGANTALRDAAMLRDALQDVQEGRCEPLAALAAYEREMIDYGFGAVRASLAQMRRVHARSPVKRFVTKTAFRLLNAWPGMIGLGE